MGGKSKRFLKEEPVLQFSVLILKPARKRRESSISRAEKRVKNCL